MTQIIPTITAEDPHIYREQMERVQDFTQRIHIDLMDGTFAPTISVDPEQVWWPEGVVADIHVMFEDPETALKNLVALKPRLIIIPAESTYNLEAVVKLLEENSIKFGLALLQETAVEAVKDSIKSIDHLLIFSGNLGRQGGSSANLNLLEKVAQAKAINPDIEVGWDGGVNDTNVQAISAAGVDSINVGGYIHSAPDPGLAYKTLISLLP